ncbi:MAG: YigZ family protein [Kangiellaceae bacterium]|nr:YigZ family protein [Kangiellaceae bacterium]
MSSSGYQVPTHKTAHPFMFEEIIKGSRFIARIAFTPSVDQAKSFVKHFNVTEPEATHHCWAYVVGNPSSTTLIACSDDGEPSGTAGMPMLNVLKHAAIGDITAVVTRYYGGTKLGTGGLARAYGGSVKQALEQLETSQRIFTEKFEIHCAYDLQKQIEYLINEVQGEILDIQFTNQVSLQLEVPRDNITQLQLSLEAYINKQQLQLNKL